MIITLLSDQALLFTALKNCRDTARKTIVETKEIRGSVADSVSSQSIDKVITPAERLLEGAIELAATAAPTLKDRIEAALGALEAALKEKQDATAQR